MLLVLIVELLNTGIETVVDRIGLERHELSGLAKDVGSTAVLLSFGLLAWSGCWCCWAARLPGRLAVRSSSLTDSYATCTLLLLGLIMPLASLHA